MIPMAAQNPFARPRLRAFVDASRELGRAVSVAQIDVVQITAAVNEPDVRIVEPRNQASSLRVEDRRVRVAPAIEVGSTADVDDAVADHGDGGRRRLRWITGPDCGVADNQIGGKTGWTRAAGGGRGQHQRRERSARSCREHERRSIARRHHATC